MLWLAATHEIVLAIETMGLVVVMIFKANSTPTFSVRMACGFSDLRVLMSNKGSANGVTLAKLDGLIHDARALGGTADHAALQKSIAGALSLTDSCSACFAASGVCALEKCPTCGLTSRSDLATCHACEDTNCTKALVSCALPGP